MKFHKKIQSQRWRKIKLPSICQTDPWGFGERYEICDSTSHTHLLKSNDPRQLQVCGIHMYCFRYIGSKCLHLYPHFLTKVLYLFIASNFTCFGTFKAFLQNHTHSVVLSKYLCLVLTAWSDLRQIAEGKQLVILFRYQFPLMNLDSYIRISETITYLLVFGLELFVCLAGNICRIVNLLEWDRS